MGILDNLSKTLTQGFDWAKVEWEKYQKLLGLQSEVSELKKQIEGKRLEFADRAIDLYRAGQIQSASLGEILRAIEGLQSRLVLKEEEYKAAQTEAMEAASRARSTPPQPAQSQSQQVPVSVEPPPQPAPAGGKVCPSCGFQMPTTSMFCAQCGTRLGL